MQIKQSVTDGQMDRPTDKVTYRARCPRQKAREIHEYQDMKKKEILDDGTSNSITTTAITQTINTNGKSCLSDGIRLMYIRCQSDVNQTLS